MKHTSYVVVVIAVLFTPIVLIAQVVNGRFSSAAYAWERFDTVGVSRVLVRGLQTLQLDVTQGNLSLQTYLGGATNFNDPIGNEGVVRVYNAFLRWRGPVFGGSVDFSIGRVPVFAGVGNGAVDGGLVRARLLENDVTVTAYGGADARSNQHRTNLEDLKDYFFGGGQLVGNLHRDFRLGLSYVRRNFKRDPYRGVRPDSLGNPFSVFFTPDSRAEQVFGVDARYGDARNMTAYGRYDYDLYSKRSLRAQFSGRIAATDQLDVTIDYIYREPRIPNNSVFKVFPLSPVREYEGGVEYAVFPALRAHGKFAFVQFAGADAKRFSVGTYADCGALTYAGTRGHAGELNSVSAQLMYPLFERRLVPTVGASYASYRLTEGGKQENIFAASVGGVLRPKASYSLDLQVQWLQNPVLSSDIRLFGKVNYWFNENLQLFD